MEDDYRKYCEYKDELIGKQESLEKREMDLYGGLESKKRMLNKLTNRKKELEANSKDLTFVDASRRILIFFDLPSLLNRKSRPRSQLVHRRLHKIQNKSGKEDIHQPKLSKLTLIIIITILNLKNLNITTYTQQNNLYPKMVAFLSLTTCYRAL